MTHVVVVGAGYAGAMASNRVAAAGIDGVVVTVINPHREFVERIRLHQHLAGTGTATRPLTEVLHPSVRLRVAAVESIGERSVALDDGSSMSFDFLVYAAGSGAAPTGVGADAVGRLDAAARLATRLRALPAGARVLVVGGGLTGIETTAEIAERFPYLRTHLVTNRLAATVPAAGRRVVERTLTSLDVAVHDGLTVTEVHSDGVSVAGASAIGADCTIWAGSFTVPDLARRSELPVDVQGRLLTDETLVCVGNPRIVGVGDATAPPATVAGHVRMSCQSAIPTGAHGADTLIALLDDRTPRALSVGYVGQAVSLGRSHGLIQPTGRDDRPCLPAIRGRAAATIKEAVCRSTVMLISRAPRHYRWMPGPPRLTAEEHRVTP
ncbi:NAD(P)/FAD-dependent oxidoreductase [Rhodococcus gannanensis]|uniref:NAD(P)/FAD-dependent oxidoreductase n=1 Tax=Rhodococcus gannanensis TaxID=1960308 RepID=A0ABW4P9C5_9NOCA